MTELVVAGGLVVDAEGSRPADVVVGPDGLIVEVGPGVARPEARTVDATGCLVTPAFVDLNVHLRQPGSEGAETFETASRAAALGGYGCLVAMPSTVPCPDNAAVLAEIVGLAGTARCCEVVPAAALTVGRAGQDLAPLGELAAMGVRVFTDGERSIQDPAVMRAVMDYLVGVAERASVPLILASQPSLDQLDGTGVMNEGEWSSRLGLPGRPAVGEELAVARDLALAKLTGARLHLQQISTARSLDLVRAAKAEGQAVTVEVSPHHLALDESACAGYDTNTKVAPPLRPLPDVEALRAGVLDGTVDAIATGHSPWPADAKERPFDAAPFGVIGLETALAAVVAALGVPVERVVPLLSWQPAAIAGLSDRQGGPMAPGRPANLTVVDPERSWTVDAVRSASRSANTPFDGRTMTGGVRHTIHRGRPVVIDGQLAETPVGSTL